jgi:ankyrin repeat protein
MGSRSTTNVHAKHNSRITSKDDADNIKIESMTDEPLIDVHSAQSLLNAVRQGNQTIVESLLNAGAHIHIETADSDGWTACHIAAARRFEGVLRLLLALAPNLSLENARRQTPLDIVLSTWEPVIRDTSVDSTNARIVAMLIAAGSPIRQRHGASLCMAAAKSTELIQALVDRGVVISDLRDQHGHTPLHLAVRSDCHDVVQMILHTVPDYDVDAVDAYGASCCHFAVNRRRSKSLRWLIEAGANVDIANDDTLTPLHEACQNGDLDFTLLLLAACADVHVRTGIGNTPLHFVARGQWSAAEITLNLALMLLAAGADLDATNDEGVTAREILLGRGRRRRRGLHNPDKVDAARQSIAKLRLDLNST